MKSLLAAPLWFAQIFSTAKSFRANPLLGSARLNRWGLHRTRLVLAHRVMRWRMALLGLGVSAAERQQYQQYGFIAQENAVPEPLFSQIEAEIRAYQGAVRECQQGDTQNHRILLDPATLAQLPHTARWLADPALKRLLRYTAGHARLPFFHIEQVRNGVQAAGHDPQKTLHADTFHPTMKFWLFLDDVDAHNGPFSYIPGSHRLSPERLQWEHRMSQGARHHPDSYSARGSFRFSPQDRLELKLPEPHAFAVRKNTLVIANTFGIHGRGQADPGSTRLALWGMSRTNPFLPFPGFGFEFINRWQYHVLNALRAWEDKQAERKGIRSAWHRLR